MKIYRLYRQQLLKLTLDEAWEFFTSPHHLNQITPDFFNVQITSPVPDKLYPGLMISYQMKAVFGLPMNWLSEISHCEQGKRFVYQQRVGPFNFLSHEVCLTQTDQGIEVEDIMFYVMPGGIFGPLLHHLLIASKLEQIFATRRDFLDNKWGI